MELSVMTIADIRKLGPCYDPVTGCNKHGDEIHPGGFLPEDWQGTALDVLQVDACPAMDRLWVVIHPDWLSARAFREFTHRLYEHEIQWFQGEIEALEEGERAKFVELTSRIQDCSRRCIDGDPDDGQLWNDLWVAVESLGDYLHAEDDRRWDADFARRVYGLAWDLRHAITVDAARYAYTEAVMAYRDEVALLVDVIQKEYGRVEVAA